MKTSLILHIALLAIVSYASSCTPRKDDPIVEWKGPNDEVELVFFYKKGASYEEKRYFENNILHIPGPGGYASQEGVSGEFHVRNSGYEGHAIEFYPSATPEQRDRLKRAIESSPIVYKVYENVVPSKVQMD